MIQRRRRPAARVHLPLRRLALCLDCDECFEVGDDPCPACGNATWTPLARFLDEGPSGSASRLPGDVVTHLALSRRRPEEPATPRHLIIVGAGRVKLYDHLRRAFAGNGTVQVLLDRRVGERRRSAQSRAPERRQGDRRITPAIADQLRALGWAVVPAGGRRPAR
jgi:hypothetical protein